VHVEKKNSEELKIIILRSWRITPRIP